MLHLLKLHLKILLEVFTLLLNDLSLHLRVLHSPAVLLTFLNDALCSSLLLLKFYFPTALLELGMHIALVLLSSSAVLLADEFHF